MKVITICGSLKFQNEMIEIAKKLTLKGNCVITPIYQVLEDNKFSSEELEKFKKSHFKKIELSDSILVVNINNYIGTSTNLEIEYAKKSNKEIIYYTDIINDLV